MSSQLAITMLGMLAAVWALLVISGLHAVCNRLDEVSEHLRQLRKERQP